MNTLSAQITRALCFRAICVFMLLVAGMLAPPEATFPSSECIKQNSENLHKPNVVCDQSLPLKSI